MRGEEGLSERDAPPDPISLFSAWYADALRSGNPRPDAMTLATVGGDGAPSARVVLLKDVDERGFVFHTNYRSAKGREIEGDPRAAAVFHWPELHRQARVRGRVTPVSPGESDAYFATRPRGARLAAWASPQSEVIASRDELEDRVRRVEADHPEEDVPRPPWWGGYRLEPETIEFWQGRENRLHDRLRYVREGEGWRVTRLAP